MGNFVTRIVWKSTYHSRGDFLTEIARTKMDTSTKRVAGEGGYYSNKPPKATESGLCRELENDNLTTACG